MPTIVTPEEWPLGKTGLTSSIGGPPEDADQFAFNTPFGLQQFNDTYRGPRLDNGRPSPPPLPSTIRGLSRAKGLGILDGILGRLGFKD